MGHQADRDGSLVLTVTRAARVLTADLDALLKPEGLATDHWLVLQALSCENGLAMTELVHRTGTNSATLTRVVDRLVSRALVYREVDPADRRKVRVHVSKRGISLHRKLASLVGQCEQSLIERGVLDQEQLFYRKRESSTSPKRG
jgi:DNA-binding MarR family transcriptional regulator